MKFSTPWYLLMYACSSTHRQCRWVLTTSDRILRVTQARIVSLQMYIFSFSCPHYLMYMIPSIPSVGHSYFTVYWTLMYVFRQTHPHFYVVHEWNVRRSPVSVPPLLHYTVYNNCFMISVIFKSLHDRCDDPQSPLNVLHLIHWPMYVFIHTVI